MTLDERPEAVAKTQPPRLTPSKSAPADVDAMVHELDAQGAHPAMARATSFHAYTGGDTQPLDSQVYRDFTESMTKSSNTTPKKVVYNYNLTPRDQDATNTYDTAISDKTPRTAVEGDTEFVNFDEAWKSASPAAQSQISNMDDFLVTQPVESQASHARISNGFPGTPALAGNKRRRSGELLTSAPNTTTKTPGYSQFDFAPRPPMLSNTQLFDQTQAPSSPAAELLRSDPVLTRPSPLPQHYNTFPSPGMISSSPMLPKHVPSTSVAGEPRTTFTRMDESQERRAAKLRQQLELEKRFGPDAIAGLGEEDEEDSQQRRLENKRMQRIYSDQAISEMSNLRAPSRPGTRPHSSGSKRTATVNLVTPGTVQRTQRVDFEISSDDEPNADPDVEIVEEPDLPAEAEDGHEGGDMHGEDTDSGDDHDNDVYDELSETIVRSQRAPDNDDDQASDHHDEEDGVDMGMEGTGGEDAFEAEYVAAVGGTPSHPAGNLNDQVIEKVNTQPAVADSQPHSERARNRPTSKHAPQAGPTSSFVPGSQYVGATSQELARRVSQIPDSSKRPISLEEDRSRDQQDEVRVASSPPLPDDDSTVPKDSHEASAVRRDMLAHFQQQAGDKEESNEQWREVPDSDLPEVHAAESTKEASAYQTAAESHSVPVFSTARTHASESVASPEKPRLVKELSKASASQNSVPSPLKAAGVRRFADITADMSPTDDHTGATQGSLDVDAIMGNVMTMDDQNFLNVLSSPPSEKPTERRRLMQGRSSSRSSKPPGTKAVEARPSSDISSPVKASSTAEQVVEEPGTEGTSTVAPIPAVRALQSSPSKANEAPTGTPEDLKAPDTPESVRRREAAGAKAASQLLSGRTTRTAKPAKLSGTGRKTAASREREVQPRQHKRARLQHSKEQSGPETGDIQMTDALSTYDGQLEGIEEQSEMAADTHGTAALTNQAAVSAPERIFALFKGPAYNAYYPATWLSSSANGATYKVRFDDTTVTSLEKKDVFALDLRVGDIVKIDYDGYRGKNWLITSFGRKPQNDEERANGVDVHDNVTLKVQAKAAQRNSVSGSASLPQGEGEELEIQVTYVKITHTMFPHFADRVFVPPGTATAAAATPVATPAQAVQTPDVETPTSRTRRSILPSAKESIRQPSRLREASVASSHTPSGASDIFENMAFAISYASNETEKAEVTRLIRRHGGSILEEGFDELFVSPQLEEPTSPAKRGSRTTKASSETGSLQLKPEYQNLGFIALVADKHSRRAKYMQALSLGLPILSGRWILDSLDPSRNPAASSTSAGSPEPRSWPRYLLPAGESAYLNGAVRSRTLTPYPAVTAKLAETAANRPMLLNSAGVLLVAPKKGKAPWERRKAFAFLTLALGAGSVRRVADLSEAKNLLQKESDKWEWVYVDDDVSAAAKVLFDAKTAGKKRRRGEVTGKDGKELVVAGNEGRVRVVGDEFVIQSLILGDLID